ncbi:MAG TPA: hypothetical protein VK081_12550 [Planctomycetota bacterium]|nr:hypothetical protein [Planctomycetota bacterium]
MSVSRRGVLAAFCLLSPACAQEPAARPADAKPSFLRFTDLGDYRGRLEVAIVRYADRERDLVVDLVSAVHVGEGEYYAELGRRFPTYDAVLYELVAPEGTRPDPEKADGFNPVSMLQRGLQRVLDLEFQLDAIDYGAENFVHADLSPREIRRLWRERGESLLSTLVKMMAASARIQQERYDQAAERAEREGRGDADAPAPPRSREARRRATKWSLAREIGPMEEMLAMFGDDDKGSGSVLVGARNARAIEVLRREIGAGKKKFAIFYGAAHMPDIADRLVKDGFERVGEEWLVAWDIDSAGAGQTETREPEAGKDTGKDKDAGKEK